LDPFDGVAQIAQQFGLWFHVDGAYGAVARLDPDVAPMFQGLERADSVALDPHKWLSVPVECGCILMRDGRRLREAFSLVPPYLRSDPGQGIGNLPWFSEYGFQQSRGFRALRLWATLAHEGKSGISSRIARQNALARYLEQRIQATPELELCSCGKLSIVCFRYRPAAAPENLLNDLNRQIMEGMQSGGVAFLTGAELRGRFVLRACILHYATTEQDIDLMIDAVRRVGREIFAGPVLE
jgi:aromatic-L-amino-acid decarboxylase